MLRLTPIGGVDALLSLSGSNQKRFWFDVLLVVLDLVGGGRITARLDVDVADGESAPRTTLNLKVLSWSVEKEGRYDRLGSDADFDDHSMGYGGSWAEWCARAIHAKKIEMRPAVSDGWTRRKCWRAT